MNSSRRPSGHQRNASTPVATVAARQASPPSGAIRYSCVSSSLLPSWVRRAVKAIRSPCGLQRGAPSFSPHCVSGRGAPPSVDSSHSVLRLLLSSIEYRVAAATACAPSGDRLGAPRRSIFHRSSMVRVLIFFVLIAGRPAQRAIGVGDSKAALGPRRGRGVSGCAAA
jgi:hypothetical protein